MNDNFVKSPNPIFKNFYSSWETRYAINDLGVALIKDKLKENKFGNITVSVTELENSKNIWNKIIVHFEDAGEEARFITLFNDFDMIDDYYIV